MKTILTAFVLLLASHALASDQTSLVGSSNEATPIPPNEFVWRLHIDGEIFIVSNDGEKLISAADEKRQWEFNDSDQPLVSNWRFESKNLPLLALRQTWTLSKENKLTVQIQQYSDMERASNNSDEIKLGKLMREQAFVVKDFAPINWEIKEGNRKIIVRLTPGLWNNETAVDVGALPFSGRHMTIFDGAGHVWADQVEVDSPAPYVGFVTHEGSIFLSYLPFKGAALLGVAKGGRVKIRDGKLKIFIMSEIPFVPNQAKVNVYGIINRSRRTDRLNSYRSYNGSKEEQFLKRVVE
jgi:hypothetical protein